jgi:hypothetical protein
MIGDELTWLARTTPVPHRSGDVSRRRLAIIIFLTCSLSADNLSRFGHRHGLRSIILTSYFYKNIYSKVIYVYFDESTFQDKSIHMVFTFSNSTILKLFMIYIPNNWLKSCPKRLKLAVRREYFALALLHTYSFLSDLNYNVILYMHLLEYERSRLLLE